MMMQQEPEQHIRNGISATGSGGAAFTPPCAGNGDARLFSGGGKADDMLCFLAALNEAPLLRAFRHGVMLVMPILLAAAIAILVNNFPPAVYQSFMLETFGPGWKEPGATLYNSTIGILALVTTYTLSNCLMELHNERRPAETVLPIMGTVTSFVCVVILIGPTSGPDGLLLPWAGIRGLFGSLVITFLTCGVFLRLCRVRKLRLSFYSEGADPLMPHMFDTLLPVLGTLLFFVGLREGFAALGIESLHQAFYDSIRGLFADAEDSFGLGALYVFLVQLAWFFGIHGADLLDPITHHVFGAGVELSPMAVGVGTLPDRIVAKPLFDIYVYMGGSGATLGLLAAIFIRSRDPGTRRVAAISLVPGLFNINELLVFGLPIVLNPAFLLPFLLVPLVLLVISYLAVSTGLAPLPVFAVDWITPPLINSFVATESWRGVALQLINLAVATLIYIPFVDLADKAKIGSRRKAFGELVAIADSGTYGPTGKRCSDRPGSPGALARALVNDLVNSLESRDGSIQLHYQPRVNVMAKTVPCVEALLRWRHPLYGVVPVSLVLAVAEDAGLSKELDNYVMSMAFEQQYEWRKNKLFTTVSINISEHQLKDTGFPLLLHNLFAETSLPADAVLLEVCETLALDPDARYMAALQAISAAGAGIAVDDFGKGYQAISRIKHLPLTELQIDRSLVRDIVDNKNCQDVVGTIQEMCYSLGLKTSAESVESREQLEALMELNLANFQGHYFQKPVSAQECAEFILRFSGGGSVPAGEEKGPDTAHEKER